MREESVREGVCPKEGREFVPGKSRIEVTKAQCVVSTVPREQRRVAIDIRYVERPAESLDPVSGEHSSAFFEIHSFEPLSPGCPLIGCRGQLDVRWHT